MRVIIGDNIYSVTRRQADGIIKTASKQVKSGIYAVEKDGIVELKNEKIYGCFQVRKAVQEYRAQGFKVYYNAK